MHFKMSAVTWWQYCLGLNVLYQALHSCILLWLRAARRKITTKHLRPKWPLFHLILTMNCFLPGSNNGPIDWISVFMVFHQLDYVSYKVNLTCGRNPAYEIGSRVNQTKQKSLVLNLISHRVYRNIHSTVETGM